MKNSKKAICSAVFALLTAIKLIVPALSDTVLDEVLSAIDIEKSESVAALGSALTSGELIEIFSEDDT